jgi:hypothetical protein
MSTSNSDIAGEGGAGGGGRIKTYVSDCAQPNLAPSVDVNGGTGSNSGSDGNYAEICGYVGIEHLSESFLWSVYPNPFNELVNLHLPETVNANTPAQIVVIDALGKVVSQYSFEQTINTINLNHLNKGIYFIQIQHNGLQDIRKISKQ